MPIDEANKLLEFFRQGGPWALVIVLGACVFYLARAYKSARDSEMALLKAWHAESQKLLERSTAAATAQAATNEAVADALDRLAAEKGDRE